MPPRKRAESKPPEAAAPTVETSPRDAPVVDTPAVADPEAPTEGPLAGDMPKSLESQGEPEKSDLQAVEQPCPICIPNGWVDGAYAMACEHGTWYRN